jgi:hypothetical protein
MVVLCYMTVNRPFTYHFFVFFIAELREFKRWLNDNGVKMNGVDISSGLKEGNGLVALRDLNEGETVIEVPYALIISTDFVVRQESMIRIATDPMVRVTPTLLLALYLLQQKNTINSMWQPYISMMRSVK